MKLALRIAALLPLALLPALPLAAGRTHGPQETRAEPALRLASRTVVLVRHAEKSTEGDPRDPALSEAGVERARELARVLGHAGVTRLVASQFQRTQATLAPLAELRKLQVDVLPAGDLERLASELSSGEPGSVTVVCGHSNTIPALAARLGAPLANVNDTPQGPQLDEKEYGRLFVLTLPPAAAAVRPSGIELRYGR